MPLDLYKTREFTAQQSRNQNKYNHEGHEETRRMKLNCAKKTRCCRFVVQSFLNICSSYFVKIIFYPTS